jgi:SAM-dependent methyltransferase
MSGEQFNGALDRALRTQARPWSLCLVAEDPERKLQGLIAGLTRTPSPTGDGKRIESGFAYWGIEPTFAWARSCTDPLYPVMKESIEFFTDGWAELQPRLADQRYHYVSFGPGTGQKDAIIIRDLLRRNPGAYYVPVDMSAEMLRLAVSGPVRQIGLPASQILPVQLDFSSQTALAALHTVIEQLTGGEPLLYSLLGNTLANFDDDLELLRTLTASLRPEDRFVLEAATADDLNDEMAGAAAMEYRRSRSFCEFATSALLRHTDLYIKDMDHLVFDGSIEDEKSLRVKVLYQNQTGHPMPTCCARSSASTTRTYAPILTLPMSPGRSWSRPADRYRTAPSRMRSSASSPPKSHSTCWRQAAMAPRPLLKRSCVRRSPASSSRPLALRQLASYTMENARPGRLLRPSVSFAKPPRHGLFE